MPHTYFVSYDGDDNADGFTWATRKKSYEAQAGDVVVGGLLENAVEIAVFIDDKIEFVPINSIDIGEYMEAIARSR